MTVLMAIIMVVTVCACDAESDGDKYTMESVYAQAQSLGYEGTLEEFIALVSGKDGADGAAGLSNYQLWLQMNDKQSTDEGYSIHDYFDYVRGADGADSPSEDSEQKAVNFAAGSTLAVISEYKENGSVAARGAGSGIIYKDTGAELYIITNYHVIYFDTITVKINSFMTQNKVVSSIADSVRVYFYGMQYSSETGYGIDAHVVGGSYEYDIAVLSLEGTSYDKYKAYVAKCGKVDDGETDFVRPVTESEKIATVGTTAIAIGNPEGAGLAASAGIVSVESEYISLNIYCNHQGQYDTSYLRVMRIDTAVNSGNSGGGLFDDNGEWIGIVNAKITSSDIENISYAIPHETASAVADNIIHYYDVQRNNSSSTDDGDFVYAKRLLLGVTVATTDSYAKIVDGKATTVSELTVSEISSGSVASALQGTVNEIKIGDVLISANIGGKDVALDQNYKLREAFLSIREDTSFTLIVSRDGTDVALTISVTTNNFVTLG